MLTGTLILFYLSDRARAVIGQFYGSHSVLRPESIRDVSLKVCTRAKISQNNNKKTFIKRLSNLNLDNRPDAWWKSGTWYLFKKVCKHRENTNSESNTEEKLAKRTCCWNIQTFSCLYLNNNVWHGKSTWYKLSACYSTQFSCFHESDTLKNQNEEKK